LPERHLKATTPELAVGAATARSGEPPALRWARLRAARTRLTEKAWILDSDSTRRLTFDMSGGEEGAKRPLRRPLDGRVRRHVANDRRMKGYDWLLGSYENKR
jgi:hypothetical protein